MRSNRLYRLAAVIALLATPVMMAGEIPDDLEGIVEYLGFDGSDVDDQTADRCHHCTDL